MVKVFGPMMSHYASGTLTGTAICSSSLRNRRARKAPPAPSPPVTHDLIVTGTITPDATGFYDEAGIYNGQPYYERTDTAFAIWYWSTPFPPSQYWFISAAPGDRTGPYWGLYVGPGDPPYGFYFPNNGATGGARVNPAP